MFAFYKSALSGEFSSPLCADYKSEWRKCGDDKERLIRLSLKQQSIPFVVTHAYHNKGLTKDYVKEFFGDYVKGKKLMDCDGVDGYSYSLYADWDYANDLVVETDVCSIMWTVGASVIVQKTKCPVIYVSNRSDVHLVCEGYNNVMVYLFDKSKVTIEDADSDTSVIVYKYSDDASVETGKYCLGKVKQFNKELRL